MGALKRPPRTLTDAEQKKILKVTGEYREHFRDHVIISLALGTGLREAEIAALNVGDVAELSATYKGVWRVEKIRRRVELRIFKGHVEGGRQQVFLPAGTRGKIEAFMKWKKVEGERLESVAPLFVSSRNKRAGKAVQRLSLRTLRHLFRLWQKRAGFDQLVPFHSLRHTAGTNIYRRTGDVRTAQRHLRHAHLETTKIYTHVSDEDLAKSVEDLPS